MPRNTRVSASASPKGLKPGHEAELRHREGLGGKCRACARDVEPAIFTRAEVAAWLKIKPRQVERIGVPFLSLGRKTKRYLRDDVLTWLDRQRIDHAQRRAP